MGFIGFILILLLFLIAVPLVRVIAAAISMKRKFKQAMGGFSNPFSGNQGFNDSNNGSRGSNQTRAGKKVYSKEEGEYVSFEEIKIEETEEEKQSRRARMESVKVESQISDVDYEEIR